jgi:hypothetical protein
MSETEPIPTSPQPLKPRSALLSRRKQPESVLVVPTSYREGGGSSFGSISVHPQLLAASQREAAVTQPQFPGFSTSATTSQANFASPGGQARKRIGAGLLTYPDGTVYEGEWLDDEQHGQGVCVYPSGNIYIGEWSAGRCEGKGIMLYNDGDIFDGHWKAGLCHGEGVFYAGLKETVGVWANGENVSGQTIQRSERDPQGQALLLRQKTILGMIRSATHCLFSRQLLQGFPLSPGPSRLRQSQFVDGGRGTVTRASQSPQQNALQPMATFQLEERGSPGDRRTIQQLQASNNPNSDQQASGGGGPSGTTISIPLPGVLSDPKENLGLEKDRAAQSSSNSLLFAVAGPSYNVSFNILKWLKYFALFMFPFLSLPHCPCPFKVNVLDLEREYVVSGAALHIDFEQPTTALYCAMLGVSSAVLTFIAGSLAYDTYPIPDQRPFTRVDIVLPFIGCILFACINAGYHSYGRVAHALERVDRKTFPRLASFAASCVDSQSSICIYTWGEDGNTKVTNAHYRWRWLVFSSVFGLLVAWLSPIHRAMRDQPIFGTGRVEQFACVVSHIGTIFVVAGVTFYVLKCTDMERQVLSQMQVVSRTAYFSGVCLLRPTDHRKVKFYLDAPLSLQGYSEGFVGWYITRCFVLYASTCSNHSSRAASMGAFFLFMVLLCLVVLGDLFYALSAGYTTNGGEDLYFSTAHLIGLALSFGWGALLLRYIYVLLCINVERRKHLYIVDVAALYHECMTASTTSPLIDSGRGTAPTFSAHRNSSGLVSLCKAMMLQHDFVVNLVGWPVSTQLLSLVAVLVFGAAGVGIYWFTIYFVARY